MTNAVVQRRRQRAVRCSPCAAYRGWTGFVATFPNDDRRSTFQREIESTFGMSAIETEPLGGAGLRIRFDSRELDAATVMKYVQRYGGRRVNAAASFELSDDLERFAERVRDFAYVVSNRIVKIEDVRGVPVATLVGPSGRRSVIRGFGQLKQLEGIHAPFGRSTRTDYRASLNYQRYAFRSEAALDQFIDWAKEYGLRTSEEKLDIGSSTWSVQVSPVGTINVRQVMDAARRFNGVEVKASMIRASGRWSTSDVVAISPMPSNESRAEAVNSAMLSRGFEPLGWSDHRETEWRGDKHKVPQQSLYGLGVTNIRVIKDSPYASTVRASQANWGRGTKDVDISVSRRRQATFESELKAKGVQLLHKTPGRNIGYDEGDQYSVRGPVPVIRDLHKRYDTSLGLNASTVRASMSFPAPRVKGANGVKVSRAFATAVHGPRGGILEGWKYVVEWNQGRGERASDTLILFYDPTDKTYGYKVSNYAGDDGFYDVRDAVAEASRAMRATFSLSTVRASSRRVDVRFRYPENAQEFARQMRRSHGAEFRVNGNVASIEGDFAPDEIEDLRGLAAEFQGTVQASTIRAGLGSIIGGFLLRWAARKTGSAAGAGYEIVPTVRGVPQYGQAMRVTPSVGLSASRGGRRRSVSAGVEDDVAENMRSTGLDRYGAPTRQISVEQAARVAGVSVATVNKWMDSRSLASFRDASGERVTRLQHLARFLKRLGASPNTLRLPANLSTRQVSTSRSKRVLGPRGGCQWFASVGDLPRQFEASQFAAAVMYMKTVYRLHADAIAKYRAILPIVGMKKLFTTDSMYQDRIPFTAVNDADFVYAVWRTMRGPIPKSTTAPPSDVDTVSRQEWLSKFDRIHNEYSRARIAATNKYRSILGITGSTVQAAFDDDGTLRYKAPNERSAARFVQEVNRRQMGRAAYRGSAVVVKTDAINAQRVSDVAQSFGLKPANGQ